MQKMRNHPFAVLFFLGTLIFLGHYLVTRQAVYGDGIGYYAHLHSWYFDHDFDNTNEYEHIYSPENNNAQYMLSTDTVQIVATSPQGKAENHYSTGVAILLSPFYILADWTAALVNLFGAAIPRNGYSDIYQVFCGVGAVIYTVLGLHLLAKICARYFKDKQSIILATCVIFLATPLLYYGSFDVINSHFASFFLTTLFCSLMLAKKQTLRNVFLLGLVGGLLISTRPQDGVALLVWVVLLVKDLLKKRAFSIHKLKPLLQKILLATAGVLLTMLPLLIHTHLTFGSIFHHRYIVSFEQQSYRYKSIELLGSLFHATNGVFTATPILFLIFLFFIYLWRRKKTSYLLPFALFFFCQFIIITLQGGWIAEAYGGRMFISSLPFFCLVLVELLTFIRKRYSQTIAVGFCGMFIALNILMMGHFILFRNEGAEKARVGFRELEKVGSYLKNFANTL